MPTALVPLLYGGDKGWRGWFFLLNPLSQGISFPRFPRMLEVLTRQGAVLPERQGVKAGAHEEQKLYILLVQLCIFPFPSGLSSFSQTISFTALCPSCSPCSTPPLNWSSLWRPSVLWLLHQMHWLWPLIALLGKLLGKVGMRGWSTELCSPSWG